MVYNKNLVAVIKQSSNNLREHRDSNGNDTVYIPYGSEYSILLKNMNTVKALVTVEVDGREAIKDLIIRPNKSVELERFFENDMNTGHKFKYVQKTDDIKNYRGDKPEDGIIRITYQFKSQNEYFYKTYPDIFYDGWPNKTDKWPYTGGFNTTAYYRNNTLRSCNYNNVNVSQPINDEGITVEGEYSNQSFTYGDIGTLNPEVHCINIQLKGYYPNKGEVKRPVTTKTKLKCDYCGKSNLSKNKFCSNCGACLV